MNSIILLSLLTVINLFTGFSKNKNLSYLLSFTGIAASAVLLGILWNGNDATNILAPNFVNHMLSFDNTTIVFGVLLCINASLIVLLLHSHEEPMDIPAAEFLTLVLTMLVGGLCMVSYTNLTMLFLGLEILSISAYILAGAKKRDYRSNEAALKYYLMGAFTTGVFLFGVALIYGATGSFDITEIAKYAALPNPQSIYYVGIILLMIAFAFKIAAAPFHFWTPDVYTGAPTIVTALMSTLIKTAAIVAFYRLFSSCFAGAANWNVVLMIMAAMAMFIGNVTAVVQTNVKRMLAYSSIAHSGYLLFALFALGNNSGASLLVYTAGYTFASILAFAGIIVVQHNTNSNHLSAFNGLGKRNPMLAVCITVAMLSLAGIPPLAGFFGKFYIFTNALKADYVAITVWAVLMSCVGVYYYLRIVINMFFKPAEADAKEFILPPSYQIVMGICLCLVVLLGVAPGILSGLI
jgi:NADH-quinone oxidoreductase subunit N